MKCEQCGSEIKVGAKFCTVCGNKINEKQDTNQSNSSNWFCLIKEDGKYVKMGPYSIRELKALQAIGKIDRETSVWRSGLEEWMPLNKTTLFQELRFDEMAPPIVKEHVTNTWVWILAFAPLISLAIYQVIGRQYVISKLSDGSLYTDYSNILNTLQIMSIVITLGLNIFLTWKDEKTLRQLGHNTQLLGSYWLIPVYLFKRAKYLKQNYAYAIVWIITFVLSL